MSIFSEWRFQPPSVEAREAEATARTEFYRSYYSVGRVVVPVCVAFLVVGIMLGLATGGKYAAVVFALLIIGFFGGLIGLMFHPFSEDPPQPDHQD